MNNVEWYCCLTEKGVWYMYVIECADSTLYTGISTDVDRRILEHNTSKRGAKYTRSRRPVKLVYYQKYPDRSHAMRAEIKFKKLDRSEKLSKIKGF